MEDWIYSSPEATTLDWNSDWVKLGISEGPTPRNEPVGPLSTPVGPPVLEVGVRIPTFFLFSLFE